MTPCSECGKTEGHREGCPLAFRERGCPECGFKLGHARTCKYFVGLRPVEDVPTLSPLPPDPKLPTETRSLEERAVSALESIATALERFTLRFLTRRRK